MEYYFCHAGLKLFEQGDEFLRFVFRLPHVGIGVEIINDRQPGVPDSGDPSAKLADRFGIFLQRVSGMTADGENRDAFFHAHFSKPLEIIGPGEKRSHV